MTKFADPPPYYEELLAEVERLRTSHEECVQMVLSASLATGHADTPQDLVAELIRQVKRKPAVCEWTREVDTWDNVTLVAHGGKKQWAPTAYCSVCGGKVVVVEDA